MSLENANLQDWLVNHGITLQPDFVTKKPPYAPTFSHERTDVPKLNTFFSLTYQACYRKEILSC